MNKRTRKIISKFFLILPFMIVVGVIFSLLAIDSYHWAIGIVLGVVMSLMFILVNLRAYNKVEKINIEDFFESSHSVCLDNPEKSWKSLNEIMEHQLDEYRIFRNRPDEIIVKIKMLIRMFTQRIIFCT